MKKFLKISLLKIFIVFSVIAIDLITKQFFYKSTITIIPHLIAFREVYGLNTGGAWSILSSNTTFLIVFTSVVIVGVVIFDIFYKKTNIVYSLSISFLLGGAIGNLIDRIALGGVRDFIYFPFMPSFPTFNMADTFIFIGAVLLFVYVLFFLKPKSEKLAKNELSNSNVTENKAGNNQTINNEVKDKKAKDNKVTNKKDDKVENNSNLSKDKNKKDIK